MPYRRCPRCGVSSYIAPSYARPAICPHCERPIPAAPDAEGERAAELEPPARDATAVGPSQPGR